MKTINLNNSHYFAHLSSFSYAWSWLYIINVPIIFLYTLFSYSRWNGDNVVEKSCPNLANDAGCVIIQTILPRILRQSSNRRRSCKICKRRRKKEWEREGGGRDPCVETTLEIIQIRKAKRSRVEERRRERAACIDLNGNPWKQLR